MISYSVKSTCALAAIVALAVCAQVNIANALEECNFDVTGLPASPELMGQYVNSLPPGGDRARDILMDGAALENAIDQMGGTGANLAAKIQSIRGNPFASGLAGVSVRSFLRAAHHTLQGANFGHSIADYTTVGQLEAYHYDSSGESCLRVRMTTRAERGNGTDVTFVYRWTVFGDFQDALRNNSDSNNVFPTAMAVQISAAMAGSFDHKLWSKGTMFRVTKVDRKIGNGAFVTLPETHPLYGTTAESCIDMMFVGVPPETLPPGATPPFYCLGRCDNPPLINTK